RPLGHPTLATDHAPDPLELLRHPGIGRHQLVERRRELAGKPAPARREAHREVAAVRGDERVEQAVEYLRIYVAVAVPGVASRTRPTAARPGLGGDSARSRAVAPLLAARATPSALIRRAGCGHVPSFAFLPHLPGRWAAAARPPAPERSCRRGGFAAQSD